VDPEYTEKVTVVTTSVLILILKAKPFSALQLENPVPKRPEVSKLIDESIPS